jgi:hypothetical protein
VFGQNGNESATGQSFKRPVGTWGDGGTRDSIGVLGTADDAEAGVFYNNSPSGYNTVYVSSANSAAWPFIASSPGGVCIMDGNGNLDCTGTITGTQPVDGGKRTVAMSAIESPVNWFEDAGSARLVNGVAVVELDSTFIQTVNTGMEYKVFPVANGDCNGLYVTHKAATSFEVRELHGGTSSVPFDYRIMALRKNYENVRFDDRTRQMERSKQMREQTHSGTVHPMSHDPGMKPALAPTMTPGSRLR